MIDAPGPDSVPAPSGPLLAPAPVDDHPPAPPRDPTPSSGHTPKRLPPLPETPPLPNLEHGQNIDTLLKRTGIEGGFVMYGKLRVEAGLASDFEQAERYLAKDPEAVKMLGMMVNGDTEHRIQKIDIHDPVGDRFEANQSVLLGNQPGGDIFWNPTGALLSVAGVTSPAVALLHEQGHAWEDKSNLPAFNRGINSPDTRFTDHEEKRNEQTTEAHAAKILGEPLRTDHYGGPLTVSGPTSRESLAPKQEHTIDRTLAHINSTADYYKNTLGYPAADHAKSVVMWDHHEHKGTFVSIDERTVALSTGNGQYQLLDVKTDLHGSYPRQFANSEVDAHGHVHVLPQTQQRHTQLHVFDGGKTETHGAGFNQQGKIVDMQGDRVVQSVKNEDGTTKLVTFSRHELEASLPKGQHVDKSLLHKNVDISIARDGHVHLDVVPVPRQELPQHDQSRTPTRTNSVGHDR